jgi:hypothetical protein
MITRRLLLILPLTTVATIIVTGHATRAAAGSIPPVAALTTLTPTTTLFGEDVIATVATVVDTARVDPGTVRLVGGFRPYTATVTSVTRSRGSFAEVRYRILLRCLSETCVAMRQALSVQPTPTRLIFDLRNSDGQRTIVLHWPKVEIVSRINPSQFLTSASAYTYHLTPLPAVSYRLSPPIAVAASGVGSVFLFGLAALFLRSYLRTRRLVASAESARPSPQERAGAYLRLSLTQSDETLRRKALARAAAELAEADSPLGPKIRELAWARIPPTTSAISEVEKTLSSDGHS